MIQVAAGPADHQPSKSSGLMQSYSDDDDEIVAIDIELIMRSPVQDDDCVPGSKENNCSSEEESEEAESSEEESSEEAA